MRAPIPSVRGWRLIVGSDEAGFAYKRDLLTGLVNDPRVCSVRDIGVAADETTPYPTVGLAAAELVSAGTADRAVLICGTGMGMAIAANKVPGIRAVTAHDSYSIERSVLSNDAQILTLGARVVGFELARRLVDEWLGYRFDTHSLSAAKVELIRNYEQPLRRPMSGVVDDL